MASSMQPCEFGLCFIATIVGLLFHVQNEFMHTFVSIFSFGGDKKVLDLVALVSGNSGVLHVCVQVCEGLLSIIGVNSLPLVNLTLRAKTLIMNLFCSSNEATSSRLFGLGLHPLSITASTPCAQA